MSTSAHVVIIVDLNDFGTSSHLSPSCSTGGNIDKQTSQGPPSFDTSGISQRPSVGGSSAFENRPIAPHRSGYSPCSQNNPGNSFHIGPLLSKDLSYLVPQPRDIPPPRPILGSEPLPQCSSSANSQTPESTFVDDLFPSEWPRTHLFKENSIGANIITTGHRLTRRLATSGHQKG